MHTKPYALLSEDNFRREVLNHPTPVLVVFATDWSGAWHIMAPAVEELASAFARVLKVGWVNADETPHLAYHYGVYTLPTVLFFKHGVVVTQRVGMTPKRILTAMLDDVISENQPPAT